MISENIELACILKPKFHLKYHLDISRILGRMVRQFAFFGTPLVSRCLTPFGRTLEKPLKGHTQ